MRHRGDQVQITFHAAALGHDGKRVVAAVQQFNHTARDPVLALHRLVGVGGGADHNLARHITARHQLALQHLGQVGFGDDVGLEVQPRRQTQVAVGRPRVAIDAAVFTTPVRVQPIVEIDIGRVVAGDGAFGVLRRDLSGRKALRQHRGFVQRSPPVIERAARFALEPVGDAVGCAAAFDCPDRDRYDTVHNNSILQSAFALWSASLR